MHIFGNCDLLWSIIRKKEEEVTHTWCRENIHIFIYWQISYYSPILFWQSQKRKEKMPKLLILWLFVKNKKNGHCARSYSQFYGICRGRWIVFMTEPITLYHDFPAKGVPHIFWTIRLKCLLAQITVPWHFYGPIQFQDYTAGYFLTHERTIHLPQKYRTTVKLQLHIFQKGAYCPQGDFWNNILGMKWSPRVPSKSNQSHFLHGLLKKISSYWPCSCRQKLRKLTLNLSVFSDSQRTFL